MTIWNEDGTPRRPDERTEQVPDVAPFTAFAISELEADQEGQAFVGYARMRTAAKANTPAGVGDIVHYWHEHQCLAAIVARTGDFLEDVDMLYVFSPEPAASGVADALHSETRILGTWHWPESL